MWREMCIIQPNTGCRFQGRKLIWRQSKNVEGSCQKKFRREIKIRRKYEKEVYWWIRSFWDISYVAWLLAKSKLFKYILHKSKSSNHTRPCAISNGQQTRRSHNIWDISEETHCETVTVKIAYETEQSIDNMHTPSQIRRLIFTALFWF